MEELPKKKPIYNIHAHVFTHKHVPPFLAKTFVIWPLYYLAHVPTFVNFYLFYIRFTNQLFRTRFKRRLNFIYSVNFAIKSNYFLKVIYSIILFLIGLNAFAVLFDFWVPKPVSGEEAGLIITWSDHFLTLFDKYYLLLNFHPNFPSGLKLTLAILALIVVKSIRNFVIFLLNKGRNFLDLLPSKEKKDLFNRYILMARFATYGKQHSIFSRLRRQYPNHSQFAILPMDMEFMDAGKLKLGFDYYAQMNDLIKLNKKPDIHTFVFIDPRRIRRDKKSFLDYDIQEGTVVLKDSFVKQFIEDEGFEGFKIYPALGYFPFDEDLLALWKYAADNQIPIMSHGIKGSIFYRGKLQKDWKYHPVFTQRNGPGLYEPLQFLNSKNIDFQVNFTHPMNFLTLLEEPLLRKLVGEGKSESNKELFGYTDKKTPLKHNLSQLKVCFAHFGGEEEWFKFLARDRDNYAQQLMAQPDTGIFFGADQYGKMPWGRYESVWRYSDWYSIICSMMIQYPNFYSDISYIVSHPQLYPLLKSTLSTASQLENQFKDQLTYAAKDKLRSRVLYGSDFYVVRSQKSDKDIFTEITSYLSEAEFDLIARDNPHEFMKQKRPKHIKF